MSSRIIKIDVSPKLKETAAKIEAQNDRLKDKLSQQLILSGFFCKINKKGNLILVNKKLGEEK